MVGDMCKTAKSGSVEAVHSSTQISTHIGTLLIYIYINTIYIYIYLLPPFLPPYTLGVYRCVPRCHPLFGWGYIYRFIHMPF